MSYPPDWYHLHLFLCSEDGRQPSSLLVEGAASVACLEASGIWSREVMALMAEGRRILVERARRCCAHYPPTQGLVVLTMMAANAHEDV